MFLVLTYRSVRQTLLQFNPKAIKGVFKALANCYANQNVSVNKLKVFVNIGYKEVPVFFHYE